MKVIRGIALFVAVGLSPGTLLAQHFSADAVTTMNGKEMTGNVYCSKDRWRIEMRIDDRHQTTIIRMDKKLIWHIAVQQKQYTQFGLRDEDLALALGQKVFGEVRRERVGTETIDGRKVVKYRVYFTVRGEEGVITQWVDDEYKIPIRSVYDNGLYTSEIRNIVPGPQPASLFELPADVTPYTIPLDAAKKPGPGGAGP